MTYKICVFLNNLKVDVYDDFDLVKAYFKSKGVDVTFNFIQTNLKFGVKDYDGKYWGVDEQAVKAGLPPLKPLDYHCAIFVWDKDGQPMRDKLTSWSNWGQLIPDTEFIQLVTAQYDDQVGWIWKSVAHEIMHSFFKRIARTGLVLPDPMDSTYVVGQGFVPYLHNDNPNHPEGNFATAFLLLKPHWKRVFKNPFNEATSPVEPPKVENGYLLPLGSKRRSGHKLEGVKYIVIHDTGNLDSTARQNVDYYKRTANDESASAHAFVDDKETLWCIPEDEIAFHVRYTAGIAPNIQGSYANDCALGIELCYFTDLDRSRKAYKNYVTHIAGLCTKYKLNPHKDLHAHGTLDPTRRNDPFNAFQRIGKTWSDFKIDVALQTKGQEKPATWFDTLIKHIKSWK